MIVIHLEILGHDRCIICYVQYVKYVKKLGDIYIYIYIEGNDQQYFPFKSTVKSIAGLSMV